MPSLVERRHSQTRQDLAASAIALFISKGFDETTMDDVAEAAGVSRRTAYRHFPRKEDLAFDQTRRWLDVFNEVAATRGPDEPTRDLCCRGLMAVAEFIEENARLVLDAWTVVAADESLRGSLGRTRDEWVERYVGLILADVGDRPNGLLESVTMAGTIVAATNALVAVWALDQPDADMVAMTADAIDYIDPLWPPECR